MFGGNTLAVEDGHPPANTEPSFRSGDRVLVLFGDTPILGTIYGANSLSDGKVVAWNVKTDASGQTYPVHEDFLRYVLAEVN